MGVNVDRQADRAWTYKTLDDTKHSLLVTLVLCGQVIKLKNIPPKEQEACKNEVELLSRMCHPNIVGYTNSFLYKNCLCIIMEYCDAGDLGDRVNEAKVCARPTDKTPVHCVVLIFVVFIFSLSVRL